MLTIYRDENGSIRTSHGEHLPRDVIWIDLINPDAEERAFIESRTKALVPSKDDLSKIEASSRIRIERGILYLSMPVVATSDTPGAHLSPAGFIIWPDMLVTVRYSKLAAFDRVGDAYLACWNHFARPNFCNSSGSQRSGSWRKASIHPAPRF